MAGNSETLWHKISHSKPWKIIHGACVVSMVFMAAGMAFIAAGAGTSFLPILQNFAQHIWTGVSTYLIPGIKGLATASGNLFGVKAAFAAGIDPVSFVSGADAMTQSFNAAGATAHAGHAGMGHSVLTAPPLADSSHAAVHDTASHTVPQAVGAKVASAKAGALTAKFSSGKEWLASLAPTAKADFLAAASKMKVSPEEYFMKWFCPPGVPHVW